MSANVGDRVRVTAGEYAGCEGEVVARRKVPYQCDSCTVRIPDPKNPAWPFPRHIEVLVDDLQRITRQTT